MKRYTFILIALNAIISIYILTDTVDKRYNYVSKDTFNYLHAQFDTAISLGHQACKQRNDYKTQLDSVKDQLVYAWQAADFYKSETTYYKTTCWQLVNDEKKFYKILKSKLN